MGAEREIRGDSTKFHCSVVVDLFWRVSRSNLAARFDHERRSGKIGHDNGWLLLGRVLLLGATPLAVTTALGRFGRLSGGLALAPAAGFFGFPGRLGGGGW